jgi:DNA-binding GntR family transcriptional regulator
MKRKKIYQRNNKYNINGTEKYWQISPQPIQSQVVARLREAIVNGVLPLGDKLVENDLAQLLGVSRGPIRDALHQLTAEGLVDYYPRIGRFVHMPTIDVIYEIQEIRGLLEGLAAKKLAINIKEGKDKTQYLVLADLVNKMKDYFVNKNRAKYVLNSQLFHETLISLTENGVLMQFHNNIMNRAALIRQFAGTNPERQQQALLEHDSIVKAILDGNEELANSLTLEHAMNGAKAMQKNLLEKMKEQAIKKNKG